MLTSQNNSRAATTTIASDILGEVRWYDPSTERSGEMSINAPQCTIGSNPGCTLCLPTTGVADVHVTLVFGKRFILLKAPYPTQISGRQIRELLIDKLTVLTIGSVNIEVVPRHELGKKTNRPRVIRSQELAEHASLLSQKDVQFEPSSYAPPAAQNGSVVPGTGNLTSDSERLQPAISPDAIVDQSAEVEDRFVAIETTLGKLQSAVEIIQSQSLDSASPAPADLSEQFAVMGRSVAEELEQRLASRLDSQAASQASLVSQIRDEALRPIETTLESFLLRLDTLSSQQTQTSDRLEALAASTDFQLAEWNQWREQLLQTTEQDNRVYDQQPHTPGSREVIYSDNDLGTFQPTYDQGEYSYHDDVPREFLGDQAAFPSYPEAYPEYSPTDYSEAQSYEPSGVEFQPGLENRFDSLDNSHENIHNHSAELQTGELNSWDEPASHIPSTWEEPPEINPFRLPDSEGVPRLSKPVYEDQALGSHYSSEGYGAYSTEYGTGNESPILTTIGNQAARSDNYSDSLPQGAPADFLRESGLSSSNNQANERGSEEKSHDYQSNSPLAAFLRSPLTDAPSLNDSGNAANGYLRNLNVDDEATDSRVESGYLPSNLRNTPYAADASSYSTSEDGNERDAFPEPTNELSLRLRQMLAELKAEGAPSNDVEESDSLHQQKIVSEIQESEDIEQNTASPWLRDLNSSYLQEREEHSAEPPYSSTAVDNNVAVDNSFDGYNYQSPSLRDSLRTDAASLESSEAIPSFDWKNGSLLSSEEVERPMLGTNAASLQDEMDKDDRTSIPDSVINERSSDAKEDRDESIEEYMQKLLQRVKQGPEGTEVPIEDLTVKTAPRSRREFLARASKSSEPVADSQEPSNSGAPTSGPTKRPSPKQVDMDALRELANSNARRAIARSETKRASTTVLIKVAITSFAIAAAALILLLNGLTPNPPLAGFVAALIVAFLWGTDCYKHFRTFNNSKQRKPHESAPDTAEENDPAIADVKSGNEAESGWRPSPI
jgi:chaperonin cofactor prefoldin